MTDDVTVVGGSWVDSFVVVERMKVVLGPGNGDSLSVSVRSGKIGNPWKGWSER